MTSLALADLDLFPLCLGANVFGWTADESHSRAVLDAYAADGGNFIDTADVYAKGESEQIIGRWLRHRNRDAFVIATKVGADSALDAPTIHAKVEASLTRLQTEHIDLLYAHRDDLDTPIEETLGAFDELVRAGKVRAIAASNYSAARLRVALAASKQLGAASFVAIQPEYNLVERSYETELAPACAEEGVACVPYFALASGFLTGKYRPGQIPSGERATIAQRYLDRRGLATLAALDEIAARHETTVAAVALAWLLAQPTVVAPIASARTPEQLADLLPFVHLRLANDELELLRSAST